jgi:hypothetical protein
LPPASASVLRLELLGAKRVPVELVYAAAARYLGPQRLGTRTINAPAPPAPRAGLVVNWGKVDSQNPAVIREVLRRFELAKKARVTVGGEDLPWPDEVRAEMDKLDIDIDRLLKDLDADPRPELETSKVTYKNWVNDWRKWEAENRNSWLMFVSASAVRKKVREWQANQDTFRQHFAAVGVKQAPPPITPPPKPPTPSPVLSTLDNISAAVIVAAVVAGGIYLAKTVNRE